jgi:hypothetical protein
VNYKAGIAMLQQATGTNRDVGDVLSNIVENNTIVINTWYRFDVDFDCTTDTYTIWKDGVQKGGTINFVAVATSIDKLQVNNNAASGFSAVLGNIHYWDYIFDGSGVAPDANNVSNQSAITNRMRLL